MSWERAIRHAGVYRRAFSSAPLIVLGYKTEHGWRYMTLVRDHPTTQEMRHLPPEERR